LGQDNGPYVACENDHWVKQRRFSWADYVDAGWDEGINCSAFKNQSLVRRVARRLRELEVKTGHPMQCPVSTTAALSLHKKYGRFFHRLVNLQGHNTVAHLRGR